MTSFLDLPGELRNGIYDAIINKNRTVRLGDDGRVVQHSISCASRQIRREFVSLFDGLASAPRQLEARVVNFDTRGLHEFFHKNGAFFDSEPHEAKVLIAMTHPGRESSNYEVLDDWLLTSTARGWNVKYQVDFDWRNYTLSDAHHSAQFFAGRFNFLNEISFAGRLLQRALYEAREARVRRELVQRPARGARHGDEPNWGFLRAFLLRE